VILFQIKNDLESWKQTCNYQDGGKWETSGNGNTGFQVPQIYRFTSELYATLLSKFTLFFHRILSKLDQFTGNDFKNQTVRTEIDYYAALKTFQKRTDALNLSFIYEVWDSPRPFRIDGFACEGTEYTPPTGLSNFPSIFSCPTENSPMEHWPNVVSIIQEKFSRELKPVTPAPLSVIPLSQNSLVSQNSSSPFLSFAGGQNARFPSSSATNQMAGNSPSSGFSANQHSPHSSLNNPMGGGMLIPGNRGNGNNQNNAAHNNNNNNSGIYSSSISTNNPLYQFQNPIAGAAFKQQQANQSSPLKGGNVNPPSKQTSSTMVAATGGNMTKLGSQNQEQLMRQINNQSQASYTSSSSSNNNNNNNMIMPSANQNNLPNLGKPSNPQQQQLPSHSRSSSISSSISVSTISSTFNPNPLSSSSSLSGNSPSSNQNAGNNNNSIQSQTTPFRFHDRTAHCIYYLIRVDDHVMMVAIFSDRQGLKESTVVEFLSSIAYSLKNGKVFEKLTKH